MNETIQLTLVGREIEPSERPSESNRARQRPRQRPRHDERPAAPRCGQSAHGHRSKLTFTSTPRNSRCFLFDSLTHREQPRSGREHCHAIYHTSALRSCESCLGVVTLVPFGKKRLKIIVVLGDRFYNPANSSSTPCESSDVYASIEQ